MKPFIHITQPRRYGHGWLRVEFGVAGKPYNPHWTVTAEGSSAPTFTDRYVHSCGQMHDDVREVFPELTEACRWHLATDGRPMHYLENTLYWLAEQNVAHVASTAITTPDVAAKWLALYLSTEREHGTDEARARLTRTLEGPHWEHLQTQWAYFVATIPNLRKL